MFTLVQADYHNLEHSEAILVLMQAYALDPMGGREPLSDYTQQHLIYNLQQSMGVTTWLAFKNETPVAIVNCVEGFSTFKAKKLLNIHDVMVLPKYRGQGLVSLMFKAIEKRAQENDYCKLTLEVLEGNAIAQKAYKKLGFSGYELDPAMGKAMFWQKILS